MTLIRLTLNGIALWIPLVMIPWVEFNQYYEYGFVVSGMCFWVIGAVLWWGETVEFMEGVV